MTPRSRTAEAPIRLDFVGIGAARCGSTWISRCIQEHPSLFMPARKELHFFDDEARFEREGLAGLRRYFRRNLLGVPQGEFTPRYALSEPALHRIASAFPGIRVLYCVREPVARAYSQYRYFRFNLKKEPQVSFLKAVTGQHREDYVTKGQYARQLRKAFGLFGREAVKVIFHEDIEGQPRTVTRELFTFLGVDPGFEPRVLAQAVNRSDPELREPPARWARLAGWLGRRTWGPGRVARGAVARAIRTVNRSLDALPARSAQPPAPTLDAETRRRVFTEHFEAGVRELEVLLGRDLAHWRP